MITCGKNCLQRVRTNVRGQRVGPEHKTKQFRHLCLFRKKKTKKAGSFCPRVISDSLCLNIIVRCGLGERRAAAAAAGGAGAG